MRAQPSLEVRAARVRDMQIQAISKQPTTRLEITCLADVWIFASESISSQAMQAHVTRSQNCGFIKLGAGSGACSKKHEGAAGAAEGRAAAKTQQRKLAFTCVLGQYNMTARESDSQAAVVQTRVITVARRDDELRLRLLCYVLRLFRGHGCYPQASYPVHQDRKSAEPLAIRRFSLQGAIL